MNRKFRETGRLLAGSAAIVGWILTVKVVSREEETPWRLSWGHSYLHACLGCWGIRAVTLKHSPAPVLPVLKTCKVSSRLLCLGRAALPPDARVGSVPVPASPCSGLTP